MSTAKLVSPSPQRRSNNQSSKVKTIRVESFPEGTPLKVQIASDLHIEGYPRLEQIPDDLIVPRAPVLALLGDIGYTFSEHLRFFLHQQSQRFEHVLLIAGNHEFYNNNNNVSSSNNDQQQPQRTISEQFQWLRTVCHERPNIHLLERKGVEINGILFLGTILWSFIPPAHQYYAETNMNDYRLSFINGPDGRPRPMTAAYTNQWFETSRSWLESQISQAQEKQQPVVVLTHHAPSRKGTSHPRYLDDPSNYCFSTDLTSTLLKNPPVRAWACGHTHYNFCFKVGDVLLVSNQRGYPRKAKTDYLPDGAITCDLSS